MMLFIIDNPNSFQSGSEEHDLHIRSRNHLRIPTVNLSKVWKRITYSGIKIYCDIFVVCKLGVLMTSFMFICC